MRLIGLVILGAAAIFGGYWAMERIFGLPDAQPLIGALELIDSDMMAQVNTDTVVEHAARADAIWHQWDDSLSERQHLTTAARALGDAAAWYKTAVIARDTQRLMMRLENYDEADKCQKLAWVDLNKGRDKLNEAKSLLR